MSLFNLNYFLKAPSPNIATLGVKTSTYEFGEHTSIQSITASKRAESGAREKNEQRSLC